MIVTLCQPTSKYIHTPLSVWYLRAAARRDAAPHHVIHVVEATIHQPKERILSEILQKEPDLAAFSCYIWNITFVLELCRELRRRNPKLILVLGGPEVSFRAPELLLSENSIDYIIAGEGEQPFPALLDALDSSDDEFSPDLIPGVYCRRDGEIRHTPPLSRPPQPPDPYSPEYFAASGKRIAYLETSRGCPFSCAFCLSGDTGVRFFDLDEVKVRLVRLAGSGAKIIKLTDRTFNCSPRRADEIFRFLMARSSKDFPPDVRFHFEVGADLFDEESLTLLGHAPPGLFQFEAGIQSFHPPALAAVCRRTDLDKLESNLRRLRKTGNIHLHVDLIAGLPFEDFHRFGHSFDRAYRLSPHMLQLGFLKLLYGSALRKKAPEYGLIFDSRPPYEIRSTPWMSALELDRLRRMEQVLERLYNSGRFTHTLRFLLKKTGLRPFDFYLNAADHLLGQQSSLYRMPLDEFTRRAYEYFCTLLPEESGRLRDLLVLDRLARDNSGFIPEFLQIPDTRLKRARKLARASAKAKTGAAILYHPKPVCAFADYAKQPDPVTGRYRIRKILLDEKQF